MKDDFDFCLHVVEMFLQTLIAPLSELSSRRSLIPYKKSFAFQRRALFIGRSNINFRFLRCSECRQRVAPMPDKQHPPSSTSVELREHAPNNYWVAKILSLAIVFAALLFVFASQIIAFATSSFAQGRESFAENAITAETQELRFNHLTIEDGLSQNLVHAICQDRRGFMWFGTKDGLNRYDGYRFTIFRHDQFDSTSISGNEIQAIYESRRGGSAGRLWIGTTSGLNLFDPATESFLCFRAQPGNPNSLSHDDVTAICEDTAGALWIGTNGGGLNRLTINPYEGSKPSQRFAFTRYLHDPNDSQSLSNNSVTAVLCDRAGALWVGTHEGVNRLAGVTSPASGRDSSSNFNGIFIRYNQATSNLHEKPISSLYEDRSATLWVGTNKGLFRLNREAERFTHYPYHAGLFSVTWQGVIVAIHEPSNGGSAGTLWLGTYNGLLLFDSAAGTYQVVRHNPLVPASLSANGVLAIVEDRSGIIWVGTGGHGLSKYDPRAARFRNYQGDPQQGVYKTTLSARGLLEDRSGALWISTGPRLYRLERASGEYHELPIGNILEYSMQSLLQDRSGRIWFDGSRGVYEYDQRSARLAYHAFTLADSNRLALLDVSLVHESRNGGSAGNIWATGDGKVSRWDRAAQRFIHHESAAVRVTTFYCLYEDSAGFFWLGSNAGLVRFDPQRGTFQHYQSNPKDRSSLSYNEVRAVCPDPREPERVLWLGTGGGGLNRFDLATQKFTHYTEKNGLPNNFIYAILADEQGRLWMSTNHGLSRFDPALAGRKAFRNFDEREGLPSDEFNGWSSFKSKSGELFFSGIKGVTAFYPEEIIDNLHVPQVVLTDFLLFNRSVSFRNPYAPLTRPIAETETLTLAHDQNLLGFEFAALDFTAPEKNRFAYKLENFDRSWNESGARRHVTYTNLPPGKYRFRVKGANSDGVWNETGASLAITIRPAFYQTSWFAALGLLALGLAVYGGYRWRVHRLEVRQKDLERVVTERTEQLRLSEARLRAIFENAPDIILLVDREEKVRFINRTVSGLTKEEVLGASIYEYVLPPYHEMVRERVAAVFESHTPAMIEVEGFGPNGTVAWYLTAIIPMPKSGALETVAMITMDITLHKQADAALRASEERYRTLAESAQDFIFIIAREGTVKYVNSYAAGFLRRPPSAIVGRPLREFFPPNALEGMWQSLLKVFASGETLSVERAFEFGGSTVWLGTRLVPLKNADGAIDSVMGLSRDITAAKRAEEEIHQLNASLERRVTERTLELQERAQRIQELERQRTEQEKLAATGRMAARVAHEINNPLGTVKTAFRLLSRAVPKEHRHFHFIGTIETEIDRIAKIVRQMLDLHRPLREEPLTFRADFAIRDVLELIKPHGRERGVSLQSDLTAAQRSVTLQDNMLRQILYNLVLNAIEASPANGLVQVSASVKDEQLEIRVADQGPGIPAKIAEQIFEPFFTTKSRSVTGGMGLGLSISKSLIEAMKGTLTFESENGNGTVWRIVIPLM